MRQMFLKQTSVNSIVKTVTNINWSDQVQLDNKIFPGLDAAAKIWKILQVRKT